MLRFLLKKIRFLQDLALSRLTPRRDCEALVRERTAAMERST